MKKYIVLLALLSCINDSYGQVFDQLSTAMVSRNNNKRSGIVRIKQFNEGAGTLTWAHHDPTQRQTLMFVDSAGNIKILAEQSPDAAIAKAMNFNNKIKNIDLEFILDYSAKIEKLTNRTTTLMVCRELLYRLSEASFNNKIEITDYKVLFQSILNTIPIIMKEEANLEIALKPKTEFKENESNQTKIYKEIIDNTFENLVFGSDDTYLY